MPFSGGPLVVRTGGVGAISVQSWDGPGVLVREEVPTAAWTECLARLVASAVVVDISNGQTLGSGPRSIAGLILRG